MNAGAADSDDPQALLDQICDTFEQSWREGKRPRLEDYLAHVELAVRPQLLMELLLSEIECRRRLGETPSAREYRARFPGQAALIERLFVLSKPAADDLLDRVQGPASAAELVEVVRRLQLLPARQLAELSALAAKHVHAKALAGALLGCGLLTAYQVNHLLQGHERRLVLGSYVLLERIGEGGMGTVFKARHKAMGRVVALKLIHKEHLANADTIKRFEREMRAVAQLNHPNIVRAFDADAIEGTYLLVLEFVEGGIDLARLVKKRGPLPIAEACAYLRQAALGLQHAHECGLVHRDIKPHNLLVSGIRSQESGVRNRAAEQGFLTPDSRPLAPVLKILDLGLARIGSADADSLSSSTFTRHGMVMGTLDYIAPEQATDSHMVDIRADLYGLGCTFYHLLTGRVPFPGGDALAKLMKHKTEEAEPIEQLRPEVPPFLADIIRTLMAKRPEDRFQTPGELVAVLDQIMGSSTVEAPAVQEENDQSPTVVAPIAMAPPPVARADFRWTEIEQSPSATGVLVKTPASAAPRAPWPRRWFGAGLGGVALLVIVLVWQPWRGRTAKKEDPDPIVAMRSKPGVVADNAEEDAKKALAPVALRAKDAKTDPAALRDDLRAFLRQHSGTTAATAASGLLGEVLPRIPSHLDTLDAAAIWPDCIEHWKTWQHACGDKTAAGPPQALVAVIGEHRQRHWDSVISVSLSPDAKLLASIGLRDQALCLWDAETMELLQHIQFEWNGSSVAFSPDGKSLAGCAYAHICVWDIVDRRLIEAARVGCPYTVQVVWSPDGALASVSADHVIRFWQRQGNKLRLLWASPKQDAIPEAAVFARQGKLLITAHADASLHVWDVGGKPPTVIQSLKVKKRGLSRGLTISADGQYLAWAGAALQLWRLSGLQEITGERSHLARLTANQSACWLGKTPVLLVRHQHRLDVVDVADDNAKTRTAWDVPPVHMGAVVSSADGAVLAGGFNNGSIRVWDVGPSGLKERRQLDARFSAVSSLAFAPGGDELAFGGEDGALHVFDLTQAAVQPRLKRRVRLPLYAACARSGLGNVPGVAFLPTGKSFVVAAGRAVELWERGPAKPKAVLGSFDGPTHSLALSPDGATVVCGTILGQLRFWDIADANQPSLLADVHGKGPASSVAFSPDGARLTVACTSANVVQIWRLPADKLERERELPAHQPVWTGFSPDGRMLAVAGLDSLVTLWDMTRAPPEKLDGVFELGQAKAFRTLDFSPDGRRLAALSATPGERHAYTVVLWDVVNRRKEREWPWPGNVHHLRFAPDGRHLAVGNSNGTVYILRLATPS